MKCQNCGAELQNNNAKFCPKCGTKVETMDVEPKVIQVVEEKTAFPHDISIVWPEWQIEKKIGKGSYGVVYQTVRRDSNVESHAAIKVISIPAEASEVDSLRSEGLDMDGTRTYFKGIVDDFVSEIQLMESLKGIQNIVSVEDYKVVERQDEIGWDIYIRMELLTPFNSYICDKNLTEQEVIKLGCDICTALEICGQRNIIHRDIKPENIFVNDFGYFKLGDFGIARKLENMTGGLSQKGTYNYMAPEVANSSKYDARVDTYSLGIVLYRLLNNNKLPFLDTDKQLLNPNERKNAVERRIKGEALPAPCQASPEMSDLILRACAPNPNARFSSAIEMKEALISVANGTYVAVASEMDKTTSVRHAAETYDATTSVRKAPTSEETKEQAVVDTFGEEPKKKSKWRKFKIISISVIGALVALGVAVLVLFITSPAYGVYKDMKSEKYEKALKQYHDEVEDNAIQELVLDIVMKDRVDDVVSEYQDGKLSFDNAVAELNALKEMGFDGADKKIKEITSSNNADTSLKKADEYYEKGDYENAITEYSKIPESNENYKEAQDKLTKVYVDYIEATVKNAKKFNASKKYEDAIKAINTAYKILPDSVDTSELETVKEESLTAYKSQITNEVDELMEDEKYEEAFALIDDVIKFDDNEYFQELKTTTESKYVVTITATVQGHLSNEDYISATRVVENALTVLPDNADLESLKKQVKNDTPTYLLDVCKPYESQEYWEYINGESCNMGGTAYTNAFVLGSESYAIFNIGGSYKTLSFMLGHIDGTRMEDTKVKIYCDGVLQREIPVSCQDLPKKITVDITGVKQIKIMKEYTDRSDYGFANATVK